MSSMTINIPDEYVQILLNAYDTRYPGREALGMNKAQWARHCIRKEIRETYRLYGIHEGEALKEAQVLLRETESENFEVT